MESTVESVQTCTCCIMYCIQVCFTTPRFQPVQLLLYTTVHSVFSIPASPTSALYLLSQTPTALFPAAAFSSTVYTHIYFNSRCSSITQINIVAGPFSPLGLYYNYKQFLANWHDITKCSVGALWHIRI